MTYIIHITSLGIAGAKSYKSVTLQGFSEFMLFRIFGLKKIFKNVGNATLENIIKIDGYDLKDVEELVESIPKQRKVKNDKNAILEAEEKAHIDINESNNIGSKIISVVDDEYPEILRQTSDRPFFLYIRGQMPKRPSVAIIGTREPTNHGKEIAKRISNIFSDDTIEHNYGTIYNIIATFCILSPSFTNDCGWIL